MRTSTPARREYNRQWAANNREYLREYNRRYRQQNREKILAANRIWHGLPEASRPQPAACECCGGPGKLHLDHCHVTGAFRGWLCINCNLGIGKLGDAAEGVQKALDYLKRATLQGVST